MLLDVLHASPDHPVRQLQADLRRSGGVRRLGEPGRQRDPTRRGATQGQCMPSLKPPLASLSRSSTRSVIKTASLRTRLIS